MLGLFKPNWLLPAKLSRPVLKFLQSERFEFRQFCGSQVLMHQILREDRSVKKDNPLLGNNCMYRRLRCTEDFRRNLCNPRLITSLPWVHGISTLLSSDIQLSSSLICKPTRKSLRFILQGYLLWTLFIIHGHQSTYFCFWKCLLPRKVSWTLKIWLFQWFLEQLSHQAIL